MKKRNKGFTLIELLAVIVVLAVIALIAVPIVLNLVNTAKKGAAQASAIAFVKEVETYILLTQMNPELPKLENGETYQISRIKYEEVAFIDLFVDRVYAEENEEEIFLNEIIDMKGTKPTSGTVTIYGNKVSEAKLITNGYNVSCIGDTCEVKGKSNTKEEEKEPEVTYPNVLDTVKTLVYDENGACKTDGSTYKYMGGCYIKGTPDNNYVWYNGFIWRIMGINSDGTIRLITDETVTSMMFSTGYSYTQEGYIHNWLNDYFYANLNDTKSIINEGAHFCIQNTNGVTLTEGRTTCADNAKFSAKVGTITVDEYLLAGGASSYLNIHQDVRTITPHGSANIASISSNGTITFNGGNGIYSVRPIINVVSSAPITSGTGTAQDFYILSQNKTGDIKGKIGDKASSGEYVKLENHTYRVVSKTSEGVRLILDDFYRDSSNNIIYTAFNGGGTFSATANIGYTLNNDVLTWLGLSNSNKVVLATYYQGQRNNYYDPYTKHLEEANGVQSKVGLIRVTEMLSGQSSTMLTRNYTTSSNYVNTAKYWTISASNSDRVYTISNSGIFMINDYPWNTHAVRPVITIDSNLDIISGSGTWKNPYNV